MSITKTSIQIKDKATYVNQMFAKIAEKYDLLNNLMTFGLHKKWKELTVKLAMKECPRITTALDVCSGTGDLTFILKSLLPGVKITCIDNCNKMLEITKHKLEVLNLSDVKFLLQDAENLSFPDSSFDLITIGFGLRNLVKKEKFIEDALKILKPNGVLACIDLGHPDSFLWRKIFFMFFYNIVPVLGQIFAGNKEAYTYLPMSLMSWYKQEDLKAELLKKGFKKCYFKNVLGGAVAIHIAVK